MSIGDLSGTNRLVVHIVIFLGFGVTNPAVTLADEALPTAPSGELRLESGRVVNYEIHFDRNALSDSVRVGKDLVALTVSGTLLRFELPAVRLVQERITADVVVCLGRGEGDSVLAGLSDGRICRVSPQRFSSPRSPEPPANRNG